MANWRFGAFPKLPYSTMQQLNLDWILDRIRRFLPDSGTIGQVLTRTKDGAAWQDAAAGGGAVNSVNGQTGDVVLDAADVGALPDSYTAPVTSVNGMTGDVIVSGGGAVDSVNGQTGAVVLDAEDVGALPDTYNPKVAVALCESSGSASAKVATCYGFRFQSYTIFQITFTNSNSHAGALTLNINGTGSYPLWINGAGSGSSNHTLPAGTYLCSIDRNGRYQIRNDGIAPLQAYGNYSASNPPPYPVRSVNTKTGDVSLSAADVGALPDTYVAPVTSVNGQTGDVVVQAGGITMQALWTNESPTSSFAGKTINVDLSSYSWFAVKYRFGVTSGTQDDLPLAVFSVDEQSKRLLIAASGSNRTGGRMLNYDATAKTITFSNGQYNGATANANAIPVTIYGIGGIS